MVLRDLTPLRERFPALSRTQDGATCIFADAPGGTQVPQEVIDAMAKYLADSNSNDHGAFATSRETDEVVADAHRAAGDFLGADPDECAFGANATTLMFALSRAVARDLGPGDEIVLTVLDHDANVAPWLAVAEDTGATIRWVDIDTDDWDIDLASLDAALSERTKVVAFTLASNAIGSITPAPAIARRAHDAGALVVCDAVHVAQHRAMDVAAIGADITVFSPYKVFGPHMGIMHGRREVLERLHPYKVRPASDQIPGSWETGTPNHEAMAGWSAAVGYLASVGREFGSPSGSSRRSAVLAAMKAFREHESMLSNRFLEGLSAIPKARLYGKPLPVERTPTFAVTIDGKHPREVAEFLGDRGIFVWDGHYYAVSVMERLGLLDRGGAVRVGFCHYHTPGEVDRVLQGLEDASA
jgi:cysteine desulfurase family protein (TIGR01976 family)